MQTDLLASRVALGLSHYQVLGLGPLLAADPDALRRARLGLAVICHPDRFTHEPEARQAQAHDAMARVNVAYAVLSDPKARRRYDLTTIAKDFRPCTACRGQGATRKQKGFTKVQLVACTACDGAGHHARS